MANPNPIPIPFSRPCSDEPEFFACGKCGKVWADAFSARHCCEPRFCECGQEIPKGGYCRPCSLLKQAHRLTVVFGKARKVSADEWDGPVFDPLGDTEDSFHASVEEALETMLDIDEVDPPKWFWAAKRIPLRVRQGDVEAMLENILEHHHEGAEFSDVDELLAFVAKWSEAQTGASCEPDETVAIVPGSMIRWGSDD